MDRARLREAIARVSREIEIFRERGIGKMKERIIAATGIYRECRCNRRSGPGRGTDGRRTPLPDAAADRRTDGGGMHLGTCYLLPCVARRRTGRREQLGISPTVARATCGHRWLFKTHLSASSIGRSRADRKPESEARGSPARAGDRFEYPSGRGDFYHGHSRCYCCFECGTSCSGIRKRRRAARATDVLSATRFDRAP